MREAHLAAGKCIAKAPALVGSLTDQWRHRDGAALRIDCDVGEVSARGVLSFAGQHIFGKHFYARLK